MVQVADDNDRYPTAKDRIPVNLLHVAEMLADVGFRPVRLLGADKYIHACDQTLLSASQLPLPGRLFDRLIYQP
jgi:hypothetical protein